MFRILIIGLVTFCATSWADSPYRQVVAIVKDKAHPRATWDKQFCYIFESQSETDKVCLPTIQQGEIKVRHQEQTTADKSYFEILTPAAQAEARKYSKLVIRYFAQSVPEKFAVHIFYGGMGTQTIFAFGSIAPDGTVTVDFYSNSTSESAKSGASDLGSLLGDLLSKNQQQTHNENMQPLLHVAEEVVAEWLNTVNWMPDTGVPLP